MFDPKNWITSSTTLNITVYFYVYETTFSSQLHDTKEKHSILKAKQSFLDGVLIWDVRDEV